MNTISSQIPELLHDWMNITEIKLRSLLNGTRVSIPKHVEYLINEEMRIADLRRSLDPLNEYINDNSVRT